MPRSAVRRSQPREAPQPQYNDNYYIDPKYYQHHPGSSVGPTNLPGIKRQEFGRGPSHTQKRQEGAYVAYDQAADDFRERFAVNKLLNRVVDAGLPFAVQHPLANAMAFAEDMVGMLVRLNTLLTIPAASGPWVLEGVCKGPPGPGRSFIYGSYPGTYADSCLGGQVATAEVQSLDQVPAGHTAASWAWFNSLERYTHLLTYKRVISPSRSVRNQFQPRPRSGLMRNPNVMRFINVTPQPLEVAALQAAAQQVAPQPQIARVIEVAYHGAQTQPAPRTRPATKSRPPRAWEKERKGLARQIGVGIAKILDLTSESAEVVDAIYRALPKEVRKKWDRKERSADNIGQYGIGGADWKLQAIWHNYHKVDIAKAITNILVNELEDRIIGGAMAARNRAIRPDRFGSNVKTEVRRRKRTRFK